MRKSRNKAKNNKHDNGNPLVLKSFRFVSSCIKTVSSNVKSAGASVAVSIAGDSSGELHKDQVLWSCFDRLELRPSSVKHVLLLGYSNGFQVFDVDDASNFKELVSRRDDPVTFLQMQPIPEESKGREGFRMSHPLLLVVASEEKRDLGSPCNKRDSYTVTQMGNFVQFPTAVRFYSLRSHNYVHILRFRSTVYMVRCSPRVVAVGLASQIYCFDALTLENKFSVVTYPVPRLGGEGPYGINIGYGPMAVGPRWLAYASNNPLLSDTGRLSPQSLSPSPGVSPSTSPGNGSFVARYAVKSSKHLATGLIHLGDMGYKTLSKYYHEFLPDDSTSPMLSNSSWEGGRVAAHSTETDNSGMVVIKDFVSEVIISQFRAHTSPISALCFDPSGTLLVTASVNGNNVNIFRILPSSSKNGSGTRVFDWNSSHLHLYKLHRGMTSAVIQDICFSQYSQWVAVVSSRGTCHIFVLSPSGGETSLQLQNSKMSSPMLSAWWSTSSFMIKRSFLPPAPAAITLSAVSRIKNNFGWLNTVTSAASLASGNVSVPPGVIAATFQSSVCHNLEPTVLNSSALEHLLVYSPSGHIIQYQLLPSLGAEQGESSLRSGMASQAQMHDENLQVKVEPIQWWDVCRRADWPEREECIGGVTHRHNAAETLMNNSDDEDISLAGKDFSKPHEQSHWYLSNAEVQMRSGRVPIWQKPKMYFYVMDPKLCEEMSISRKYVDGEIEIHKLPVQEVEVRQQDLLPLLHGSHGIHPDWSDGRVFAAGQYFAAPSNSNGSSEKFPEDPTISHRTAKRNDGINLVLPSERTTTITLPLHENYVMNSSTPIHGSIFPEETMAGLNQSSESVVTSDVSNPGSNRSDLSMNIVDDSPLHENMHGFLDFGHDLQEGYCKPSAYEDNLQHVERSNKKSEEYGHSDDLLGEVFAFSE
ncbi:autophagy-related protein 18h-like isoform X1 [Cynara cardunculus var. scolymus]|uniref:autophagy-related protein 18h-like isoform X1 n=1 Tax=Cynara cardunculus var. scolymus TaxID=59895 RepID=UPI000D625701|nr:autophagy-related protein 18h-like isoform X1 [Cynara cardunculus var. scolymus]